MARYTVIQSGDFNAAENIGALAGDIRRNGVVDGLSIQSFSPTIPEVTVSGGKTVHIIDSQLAEATLDDGTTVSEQRDQVQLVAHVDAQTVGLADGAVNELYVRPRPDTDDSAAVVSSTSGSPTTDAVKVGEVDTAADTLSEGWNRIVDSGGLSFPDETAADKQSASLQEGTIVYARASNTHFFVE